MKLKLLTSLMAGAIAWAMLIPVPSNATTVCDGAECTITLDYTGSYQSVFIPQGATNLRFDVQGARGGRYGGFGGRVTGSLPEFTGELIVFVGGQGREGSGAAGGFNGGGNAGSGHQDEGSGGGASDIRTSWDLDSRLIVAGGGGGTGGWSGATGGQGGGLVGATGQSGQGSGGQGGSQSAGGAPGSSNGGYLGSAGTLGFGGVGGTSSGSGGGGGGGGYFGGGGGGADVDTCCSDGGGGGGGSSFAIATAINVEHTQGFRDGNGLVTLRYALPPALTDFTYLQQGPTSLIVDLKFNSDIQSFSSQTLIQNKGVCDRALEGSGSSYQLTMTNCDEASFLLYLPLNSVTNGEMGPRQVQMLQVNLDQQAPEVQLWFGNQAAPSSNLTVYGDFGDAVNQPSEEDFELTGCGTLAITSTAPFEMNLADCSHGKVELWLKTNSVWDSFGNSTPDADVLISHELDLVAPQPSFELVDGGSNFVEVAISGAEQTGWTLVQHSLGQTNCKVEFAQTAKFTDCELGEIELLIPAFSLIDQAGNAGPENDVVFRYRIEPVVLTPVTAEPSPSPIINEPLTNPEPEAALPAAPIEEVQSEPLPASELTEAKREDSGIQNASVVSDAASGETLDSAPSQQNQGVSTNLTETFEPAPEELPAVAVTADISPLSKDSDQGVDQRLILVLLGCFATAVIGFVVYRFTGK